MEEVVYQIINEYNNQDTQDYFQKYQNLIQIKVYEQFNKKICGFHSLFNSFHIIDYLSYNQSLESINKINSAWQFWYFYHESYKYLMDQYPNKSDIIIIQNLGVLERSHLEFFIVNYPPLLEKKQQLAKQNLDLILVTFYYGFGIVQLTNEKVDQFNQIIKQFNACKNDQMVIIFAGITNHWITIVAHKVQDTKQFYLLDSSNLNLQSLLSEDVDTLLLQADIKFKERGQYEDECKRKYPKYIKIAALKDRKTVIELIQKCFCEEIKLEIFMIENLFKEMLQTFEEYFPDWIETLQSNQDENEIDKIKQQSQYKFIKNEYRPQVISHDILNSMIKYGDNIQKYFHKQLAQKINSWIDYNINNCKILKNDAEINQEDQEMIEKYILVLSNINEIFYKIF